MIESTPHGQTGARRTENAQDDLSAQKRGAEENIGLPGQGSKSHLDEVKTAIPPAHQPPIDEEETDWDNAQDSLTEAVMENLRVGAGSAGENKAKINSAAERKSNSP